MKETEVRPGQWCVIFGMGGLGHVGLQYARFMGLNTIAIDVQDHALHLAKQLGADMTINAAKEDPGTQASFPPYIGRILMWLALGPPQVLACGRRLKAPTDALLPQPLPPPSRCSHSVR